MKEGKMRKFAYTHRTENNQTDGSKTETTLSSVDTRGSWPIIGTITPYFGSGVSNHNSVSGDTEILNTKCVTLCVAETSKVCDNHDDL